MNILAFDTSTVAASVAVLCKGELKAELSAGVSAKHGETLMPLIEQVMQRAQLDMSNLQLIAVGIGPGSFTGTRIGLATAKGLALAASLPLIGVVGLRAMARALPSGNLLLPMLDAHKGEVYTAVYEYGAGLIEKLAPFHATPDHAAARIAEVLGSQTVMACGEGFIKYQTEFENALGASLKQSPQGPDIRLDTPRAEYIAREALQQFNQSGASDLALLEPLYLRGSDAKLPALAQTVQEVRE